MKIEKINENQIRCTLTRHDLAERQIKISELAYGSDKAKMLFKDMMEQASYECGFEAGDIPLVIEAIPLSGESIVLTVTKVEDPDELDARFSKFAPSVHDDSSSDEGTDITEEVMNLFEKIQNSATPSKKEEKTPPFANGYIFTSMEDCLKACRIAAGIAPLKSSLYKDDIAKEYLLAIYSSDCDGSDFNRVCNMMTEFGQFAPLSPENEAILAEHYELYIKDHALTSLAQV